MIKLYLLVEVHGIKIIMILKTIILDVACMKDKKIYPDACWGILK